MPITVKMVFSEFGIWLKSRTGRLLRNRTAQTHILAFLLGLLIGVVGLRVTTPEVERAEPQAAETVLAAVTPLAEQTEHQADYDAACVARVLYGVRNYGLSENAKTAIIEVIKNRMADTQREFRTVNTIEEVCEQPNQWQGYISGGNYLKEDYDLALEVLHDTSSARTIPDGCFFLVVNTGEVIARTEWDGGNEWSVR